MKKHMAWSLLVPFLAMSLTAQQAQIYITAGDTPAWEDVADTVNVDGDDDQSANGPTLTYGTGADGAYLKWTFSGSEYRVLRSAMTLAQWEAWYLLRNCKIEFTITSGDVTDVHEDV